MFARIAVILALLSVPMPARGQVASRDDFEGPQTVLRAAGGDARHQVELHDRTSQGVHSGRWCEQLRLVGNNGTAVYFSYPIAPAHVISELTAGVWLRADRPGLQIVARVVLPRSKHPSSGEPLTTLVRGSSYTQVGSWQLVRIENLPRALEWQVRVLRTQFGPQVDPREAYVDLLLLNVYGGPGTTNVWVDDFEMTGAVAPTTLAEARARDGTPASYAPDAAAPPTVPSVEFKGKLLVGGQPFFPRIIEHRGEPLARLKALGFNCVRVARVPTTDLLTEAARSGIWLVAPPPSVAELEVRAGAAGAGQIGPAFDPVLAWDLGSGLSKRDFERTRQWAELVQSADARGRPIVVGADSDLANFTRPPFKVLLAERETLGTTLELKQFGDWLANRAQLARGGAPLWVAIPTQPAPRLVEQMRLVAGANLPVPAWQEAQMRALVYSAVASRARGLYFSSQSRLDAPDAATRMRAAMLELLNLELELIERWPAAGNFTSGATTSDPNTTGGVMETDRSRLLLPTYAPPGGQFVLGTQPAEQVSFRVAGVPEGDNAYGLSLTTLRPLHSDRVAGGTQVVLDEFSRDSLVVFTQDPLVLRNLRTKLEKNGRRAAQVVRELAAARLAGHDAVAGRLGRQGPALPQVLEARAKVDSDLQQYDALAATDIGKAYDRARHALQILRQIERVHWEQATAAPNAPLVDPLTASFATLGEHYAFAYQIANAERSENRLREGSCENLSAMLGAGWKHYLHELDGIKTGVDLTPRAAHSGGAGLLLRAEPADPKIKPAAVESPPVWVTTAPVAVEQGDLVQIQAWVNIDAPITLGADGLVILDTLSGRALALRMSLTEGWRQITMYRAAARSGSMAVTFALAGLGTAAIDDVTMQIVRRGRSVPLQAGR